MFDPRVSKALLALRRVLDSLSIPWYFFGAQAAQVWGLPRSSGDIDATVSVSLDSLDELLRTLQEDGELQPRAPDPAGIVHRLRVLPLVHLPSHLPIDLVFAGPGIEDGFFERVRYIDVGGHDVPVISPEDLLISKTLAGRSKDVEDIHGILFRQRDRLDLKLVRSTLRSLEQMLDRSDLLPVLEKELARIRN